MSEIFKINDVEYKCEFKLSNPDKQEVKFTKSAIRVMDIIDNVFEPFMSGSITIANPYDFTEKDYFIRGDGRDEFLIKFEPKKKGEWDNELFEQTFVVVDDTDIVEQTTRSENHKVLYLVAKDSIPFSDNVPYGTVYSGKIGDILKDIFKELLGEDKINEGKWESGDFELTYYPPATFRYMDVVRYLLRIFYSKDDDLYVKGFINYNNKEKKYEFELISKIFQDHSSRGMESFVIGDLTSSMDFSDPNNPTETTKLGKYVGQVKNLGYSTPMYYWNNDYFLNSLVVGYDRIMGQQKIKKIKFEDVRKKWESKFVKPFTLRGGSGKPFAVKNKTTDKRFKRYDFPYPAEVGVKIVEAEIHNSLTFYNLQMSFTNIGNTNRSSGKFIDLAISRTTKPELKSNQKLLGRWFVTEVHHIFNGDLYINKIYSTKTYIGPNAKIKEEVF